VKEEGDNEVGHDRVGQLWAEDGQHAEAVKSFRRTLELNPLFSKVYQLLASSHLALQQRDEAVKVLKEGWKVADERGDKMPRDEMGRMLVQLGETVPQSTQPAGTGGGPGGRGFSCQGPGCRMGARAHKLEKPPMPDEIGERIQREVCADCWDYWFRNYSIKVINELRLDLSTEHGQEEYDRYMREFLGFNEPVSM